MTVAALVDEVIFKEEPAENITITTDFPLDLPAIYVDPQQIRQVLANLIRNACQAMPDGGTLTVEATAVNQKSVKITVTDTGIGMSDETKQQIFEPLFTTKARGIGLGLVVSKNLVELNNGRIDVTSTEGEGSTFNLTLPQPAYESVV